VFDRSTGEFLSDRDAEASVTPATLLGLAAAGAEQTWTLVPLGIGVRLGIDRDEDGFADRTEIDAGSSPTDAGDTP
jgi:hypothetical protein